jgi:DNA repair protein RecN (Recombination protein N)
MLSQLRIRSLALIDDVSMEFGSGFTVFTGETGAGKSILVGAIGLLLGERASADAIRTGAEEAEISGTFNIDSSLPQLDAMLNRNGIKCDDSSLICRRIIARNNRNRIWINQTPVTLAVLKECGDLLIDLHGQHEHQALLRPEAPRMLIDSLPGVQSFAFAYQNAWQSFEKTETELSAHIEKAEILAQKKDFIEFQYREISSLELKSGEESEIEAEIVRESSSGRRMTLAASISETLEGNELGGPLDRRLSMLRKDLEALAEIDSRVPEFCNDAANAITFVSTLMKFTDSCLAAGAGAADPAKLDRLNERLARIQRLKKKYKCDFAGLLQMELHLKNDLESLDNINTDRAELEKNVVAAKTVCVKKGRDLSKARLTASIELDKAVSREMENLGFVNGEWKTVFLRLEEPCQWGIEETSFHVRTNPGEPLLPLISTASGGEISRLMLAVKTYTAGKNDVPIMIFDEIDSGIGGTIAVRVGAAMKKISTSRQILCISHLHQIASIADNHILVFKKMEHGRTVTTASALNTAERIDEIARMLGGKTVTTIKHARELLSLPDA